MQRVQRFLYQRIPFVGEWTGVDYVLRSAFGGDDVFMSDAKVLHSSLVITSYQLDYDRPVVFFCSTKNCSKEGAH